MLLLEEEEDDALPLEPALTKPKPKPPPPPLPLPLPLPLPCPARPNPRPPPPYELSSSSALLSFAIFISRDCTSSGPAEEEDEGSFWLMLLAETTHDRKRDVGGGERLEEDDVDVGEER